MSSASATSARQTFFSPLDARQSFHTGHQLGCQTAAISWQLGGDTVAQGGEQRGSGFCSEPFWLSSPSIVVSWPSEIYQRNEMGHSQPCITRAQQARPRTFLALTVSSRKVFCWQPRTGIKHRASPRFVPLSLHAQGV